MPITPFFLAANFPWTFPGVLNYWDARYGVTSASERVSAWAATLKGSASLDQASGAAQPILLPYAGVNYLWLPGVASNHATAPDSAALSVTGDITLDAYYAANDWTPAVECDVFGKWAAGQASYYLTISPTGVLRLYWSADGTNSLFATSTVATGITDYTAKWLRATIDVNDGSGNRVVKFYLSDDGSTWSQLGSTVTTAGTTSIFDGTAVVTCGSWTGSTSLASGKLFRGRIYNGFDGAGTLVFDANFTAVAEGATSFTESSSNGATVTINSTGAKPAYIVGSQMIIGDAAAYFLQSTFTLNPPYFLVEVGMEPTWASGQVSWDGKTANSFALQKITASPQMRLHDASADGATVSPTLKTWYVRAAKQSAAGAATLQLNTNAPTADTLSATAMAGLTVFADGAGANFSSGFKKAICVGNTDISADSLNQLVLSMISQYRVSA